MAPPQATVYAATRTFSQIEIQSGTPPWVRLSDFNTNFLESNRDCWENIRAELDNNSWKNVKSSLIEKGCANEIDLTYRSGADGYCNNPLDPDDMHKQILKHQLDLLYPLVEKGRAYEAAINAATEAFKSTDTNIRWATIHLLRKLVDQGQGYEVAINAATEAFQSTHYLIREQAMGLCKKLIDQGQGFNVARSSLSLYLFTKISSF